MQSLNNGLPNTNPGDTASISIPNSPRERLALLRQLVGEPACRQLGIYPIPDGFKLSVVIPVYNEERWVREVVRRVRAVDIPKEIVIVEDCSTDSTREILKELEGGDVLHGCNNFR